MDHPAAYRVPGQHQPGHVRQGVCVDVVHASGRPLPAVCVCERYRPVCRPGDRGAGEVGPPGAVAGRRGHHLRQGPGGVQEGSWQRDAADVWVLWAGHDVGD